MALIEIGRRNYLLYLVLPHPVKMALLSRASRAKLDVINRLFNETVYSGEGASNYDQIHRYAEAEQHDHPCRTLIEDVWAPEGYGRSLDLGAGSGCFTTVIARLGCSARISPTIGLSPSSRTSATGRPTTSSHGERFARYADAADSRTSVLRATGFRSRAESYPTRAAASARSASSE